VLPANLLERLGILRMDRQRFRSAGNVVTRDVGAVTMHYDDASGGVTVAFGEDDPPIMGLTSLLTMGLEVDPEAGRLKHVEILML
jgi:predicted aspartyl protease